MPHSTALLAAGLAVAYGILLIIATRRRGRQDITRRWLALALLVALAGAVIALLPEDAHTDPQYRDLFVGNLTQPALAIIAANLMLVLFGIHTLRYLQSRLVALWGLGGIAWWIAQAAVSATTTGLNIGQTGWYRDLYDPFVWPNALAVSGWLVIAVTLMLAALYGFYRARLPEIANQALFMALLIPLLMLGVALGASNANLLTEIGWVVQGAALLGAVYGLVIYRVLDLRRAFRQTASTGILIVVTALVIFAALVIARRVDAGSDSLYLILGGLALALAVAYLLVRALTQVAVERLFGSAPAGVSQQLRRFSEDITGVVELDELVEVMLRTLRQVLRVRRGGLMLVTGEDEQALRIEPLQQGMGEIPDIIGQIACDQPIHNRLVRARAPLLQYDLDYDKRYAVSASHERAFFQQMRMSAYAPVVVQGHLVGILCCGAKVSDDPFTEHDLELLMTIANQTGVALRNARLVADLRRRETEQADLNRAISATKTQLERLDGVKTDFITIASHELRTPLAQIRGYTDIMEAMNEQEMLDQDQIAGMTANLRKAADRLENLIGAMLDVSQLDVDAMDLRFSQTSVEHCIRTAIEPLTESIQQRKLMLSARGLRDLPPIQADMQRLVQAFRNVVLNAIKYTPDGGRIDVNGRMQGDDVIIAIKDSGIGIDPKNRELIFEKFFRAHDPSLHSTGATKFMGAGPGLGLTIARGVITAHGGRIWVESPGYDPEKYPGSTFYVALPLTPPEGAARIAPFEPTVHLDMTVLQEAFQAGQPAR